MKRVFKYVLKIDDYIELMLPDGAEILKCDVQGAGQNGDQLCLWALVNPDATPVTRRFRLAGTGHVIKEENLAHIDTFQIMGGRLVFHIFEIL